MFPVANKTRLFKVPLAITAWSFFAFGHSPSLKKKGKIKGSRQAKYLLLTESEMSLFTSPSSIYLGIVTCINLDLKRWEDIGMHISPYSAEEI